MALIGCDDPKVQKFISDVKNDSKVQEFISDVKDDPSIQRLISDVKTGLNVVNADIQAMTCEEDVKGMAKGVALNTPLGSTVSIVTVRDIREISRTEENIVCIGNVLLDDARKSQLRMEVFKDEIGNIFYFNWLANKRNYSTVTDFAKFRGLSTSVPLAKATWYASSCRGME